MTFEPLECYYCDQQTLDATHMLRHYDIHIKELEAQNLRYKTALLGLQTLITDWRKSKVITEPTVEVIDYLLHDIKKALEEK